MVLPALIDKVSLLVAVHGKELGLKMLIIYVILALTQSSVTRGIFRVVLF